MAASEPRIALAGVAGLLAVVDLATKAMATNALGDGRGVDLGVVELRLAHNQGVAFGLGADVPSVVLVTITGLTSAVVAGYAWRVGAAAGLIERRGLSMVLAGAVANLVDRAGDGFVTDYLDLGWWPTFNLADVLVTLGAAMVAVTLAGGRPSREDDGPAGVAIDAPVRPPDRR